MPHIDKAMINNNKIKRETEMGIEKKEMIATSKQNRKHPFSSQNSQPQPVGGHSNNVFQVQEIFRKPRGRLETPKT